MHKDGTDTTIITGPGLADVPPPAPGMPEPVFIETQATIGTWCDSTFNRPADGIGGCILRLIEEATEAAIAHGDSPDEIFAAVSRAIPTGMMPWDRRPNLEKLPEELADVAIVLDTVFHGSGIDRDGEKTMKMRKNRARKWGKTLEGCGQHTQEEGEGS